MAETGADVRVKGSAAQMALALVADKWTSLLLYGLARGPMRYLQIQREVEGISQKMLTQTLQALERGGLVDRHVFAVVPPKVEYSLTPLGKSLVPAIGLLCGWCEQNAAAVESNRATFERRA